MLPVSFQSRDLSSFRSALISHASLPDSRYSDSCSFPFALPCFAPTAVPQVPAFRSPSGVLLCFRFLSSASALGFRLLSLCFFLSSLFPALPHSGLPGAPQVLSFPRSFLRSFRLVSHPFTPDFKYSASCSFPFVPPCFAPTAVPQVLPFQISPPGPTLSFCFLIVRFRLSISLLGLLFFFSRFPLSCLTVRLLRFCRFRFRFLSLPRSFRLVSRAVLPVRQYSAFRLFPFALPSFTPTLLR